MLIGIRALPSLRHRRQRPTAFQGNPTELRNYSRAEDAEYSETARRLTNLFTEPDPVVVKDRRYDAPPM